MKQASTHQAAIHSICVGRSKPASISQPVMPGPVAVAKTIADTVIARMPPRLA